MGLYYIAATPPRGALATEPDLGLRHPAVQVATLHEDLARGHSRGEQYAAFGVEGAELAEGEEGGRYVYASFSPLFPFSVPFTFSVLCVSENGS